MAGGAAIDRDQQRRAALGERTDGIDIRAIAFENAIGNVDERLAAPQPRRYRASSAAGGRAIDVVVAENRDLLAARHRVGNARGRGRHAGEHVRVGHQPPDGRVEERLDLVRGDATPGDDAGQQVGQAIALSIAAAKARPRSSSRSRQARPVAERSTPRK